MTDILGKQSLTKMVNTLIHTVDLLSCTMSASPIADERHVLRHCPHGYSSSQRYFFARQNSQARAARGLFRFLSLDTGAALLPLPTEAILRYDRLDHDGLITLLFMME